MKTLFLSLLLVLAACQTDQLVRDNLPSICRGAEPAYLIVVASQDSLSSSLVKKATIAWATLEPLCADPTKATTASVLIAAASAYATIRVARDEARKVQ